MAERKEQATVTLAFAKKSKKRKRKVSLRNRGSKYDPIIDKIREACTDDGDYRILEITEGNVISARMSIYTRLMKLEPFRWLIEVQEDESCFAVVRRSDEEMAEAIERSKLRKKRISKNAKTKADKESKPSKVADTSTDEDFDDDDFDDE